MAKIESLVPKLTSAQGPGVKITSGGETAWKAFDGRSEVNGESYAWSLGNKGWRTITIEFDSPVIVTQFDLVTSYTGLTNISKEDITVDGGSTETFSIPITYVNKIITTEFKLTTSKIGKKVVLSFYVNETSSFIQEIILWGYKTKSLVEIDGKLFSFIDNKLTLVSETPDFTLDLVDQSASLPDVIKGMDSIKSMSDKFKIQTIVPQ